MDTGIYVRWGGKSVLLEDLPLDRITDRELSDLLEGWDRARTIKPLIAVLQEYKAIYKGLCK